MANMKFKVLRCTPNSKGGFVWTLQTETKAQAFGVEKVITRTWYIGNMPKAFSDKELKKGIFLEEDLDRFDIVPRKWTFATDAEGKITTDETKVVKQEERVLNWLQVKAIAA